MVVDDLANDDRWGGYRMPALGHGVRSSLSLPLRTDGEVLGALNIYATTPRAFGPGEQLVAGRFADEASARWRWPCGWPSTARCRRTCRPRWPPAR